MKLKQLYNPKEINTGYFDAYFIRPFIRKYADFKGYESKESYLKSLLAWFVVSLGLVGLMLGQIGIIGPEGGVTTAVVVCVLWGVLSLVPLVSLTVRTLHGNPKQEIKGRMLGIDILQFAACILFFVLGLLMMITTFNSGELNPNARVYEEDTTRVEEKEYIKEEPIFTYETVEPEEENLPKDTLPLIQEEDYDFDPSIEPELVIDSIF